MNVLNKGIIETSGNAVIKFEAKVKAYTVHTALDLAEKQAKLYADNRDMVASFTKYEITNAEPTDVIDQKVWTILYS